MFACFRPGRGRHEAGGLHLRKPDWHAAETQDVSPLLFGILDMPTGHSQRSLSYIVLCVALIVVTVVFGVRAKYVPGLYQAIAGVQFAVICIAGWKLGAWAIVADAVARRRLAVAGVLLVTPWALFSFLPGIGPPGDQTPEENQLRYLILLIDSIAIAGGLVVLKEALDESGERFYSTLGFVAIMLATPLYLIWATFMLGAFRALEQATSGEVPPWILWMSDPSDILLFFGCMLTYVSTAAFAVSLGQSHWLGRRSTRAFVAASVLAVLFLVIRGLQFPNPTAAMLWYRIPGYVVGIPALPWIMPCWFGVSLLRRAGDEQRWTTTAE